jgi:two-component system phosphate regulon response regulator PhoB
MEQQHLLVIEDDPAICELLIGCLSNQKVRISVAHSGEDGLRVLDEDRPELVILDLMLPGMNGLDVCRAIRRDPWMEKIPILMLTGRVEDDDIVAGLEVGADDYMTKPFTAKVLRARVNALMRRQQGTADRRTAAVAPPASALLEIRCLGRCELQFGDQLISWSESFSPAQRMLLATLLAVPGGRVSQEEIQVGFWPDTVPVRARSNFDSLMTRLRKTLEQSLAPIEVRRHLVLRHGIVCLENVRVDAHEFRRLAGNGLKAAAAGELWQAEMAFSSALSLWQGTFLPGGFGSETAAFYQDELEQLYLDVSKQFARILAERGRYKEAIKLLRYALRYNPTHDGLTRLLYQLLLATEQRLQARQLLDHYASLLAREKFSPGEIRSILDEFPGKPPAGGWLNV